MVYNNAFLSILSRLANVEQASMNLMNLNLKLAEELPKRITAKIDEKFEQFSQKLDFHDFQHKLGFDGHRNAVENKIDELKLNHRLETLYAASQELNEGMKCISAKLETKNQKVKMEVEEKNINLEKSKENIDKKIDALTKKLEVQNFKVIRKLHTIDEQLDIFTKYLEENSSGLKLICTRFDQSTLLDASLDIKLDSSLACIRNLSSEIEKIKSSIAGYNEKDHQKKGCYYNWGNTHDNLLGHNFLPCHDLMTALGEFLMHEDQPTALSDLEKNLCNLKYKCIKVSSKIRFPNDGQLYADLDDTPMSITFTNFLEAVRSNSVKIGKPFVNYMISTLTEPNMMKYGIYDCKNFELKYGLRWGVA